MMTSKEIRRKAGISRDTLRHYLDQKLLIPQRNPSNGYRLYSTKDYKTLVFILRAKDLGFSLREIHDMVNAIAHATCPHQRLLPRLKKHRATTQQKIKNLKNIERHLTMLIKDFSARDCHQTPTSFSLTSPIQKTPHTKTPRRSS